MAVSSSREAEVHADHGQTPHQAPWRRGPTPRCRPHPSEAPERPEQLRVPPGISAAEPGHLDGTSAGRQRSDGEADQRTSAPATPSHAPDTARGVAVRRPAVRSTGDGGRRHRQASSTAISRATPAGSSSGRDGVLFPCPWWRRTNRSHRAAELEEVEQALAPRRGPSPRRTASARRRRATGTSRISGVAVGVACRTVGSAVGEACSATWVLSSSRWAKIPSMIPVGVHQLGRRLLPHPRHARAGCRRGRRAGPRTAGSFAGVTPVRARMPASS